jgi:hypothetical protein
MFIGEGGRIGRRDLLIMILISKRGNLKSNINVQDNFSINLFGEHVLFIYEREGEDRLYWRRKY